MTERKEKPLLKFVVEIGPLAVFFAGFRYGHALIAEPLVRGALEPITGAKALDGPGGPLFVATVLFMAATMVSLAVSWWMTRHLPRMTVITAVVVAVFGGLTLWLHDETFIKMKPTIVYGIFAGILGIGLMQGRSYLKYLMGTAMALDDAGWMSFTRRWVGFFLCMAVLNEAIWRTQTTDIWITFKTFCTLPLTFVFLAFQWPLLKRHMVEEH